MKKTITVASLTILLIGVAQGMAGQSVPALKDVFKDTFLIGGALNRRLVTGQDPNAAALAAKHFSTATSENDLKWLLVHPRPNQYNWEPADSYVAVVREEQNVRHRPLPRLARPDSSLGVSGRGRKRPDA